MRRNLLSFDYTTDPEAIPTYKIVSMRDGSVRYQCPDCCWVEHLEAWRRARLRLPQEERKTVPEPMPAGHLMFSDPIGYGCVSYGSVDAEQQRQAHEVVVRNDLHGWDEGVDRETLEKIVSATVKARMAGQSLGAAPYLACLTATL